MTQQQMLKIELLISEADWNLLNRLFDLTCNDEEFFNPDRFLYAKVSKVIGNLRGDLRDILEDGLEKTHLSEDNNIRWVCMAPVPIGGEGERGRDEEGGD